MVSSQVLRERSDLSGWEGTAHEILSQPRAPLIVVHDDIELVFVSSGSLRLLVGGSIHDVELGALAVFWAGMPHVLMSAAPGSRLHLVHLPLDLFLQWPTGALRTRLLAGAFIVDPDPRGDFAGWVCDIDSRDAERRDIALLEIQAMLRRMAATPDAGAGTDTMPPPQAGQVAAIVAFVEEHYREPLTTATIGTAIGLHPKYAITVFRRACGVSLWDYVRRLRLSHAQRLLVTSDMNLIEVAFASGFGSESQFYATFRRYLGQSPRMYRIRRRAARVGSHRRTSEAPPSTTSEMPVM